MAGTRGEAELTIDPEDVLLRRGLPPVDVETLHGEALLQRLLLETRRTNELLETLVLTTRYSRGNFDGPFLTRKVIQVPQRVAGTPILVPTKLVEARGIPMAVVVSWPACPAGSVMLLSSDKGAVQRGKAVSTVAAGEVRLMLAPRQELWAGGTLVAGQLTAVPVTIEEGRL